jgi:hypothetical protein
MRAPGQFDEDDEEEKQIVTWALGISARIGHAVILFT